LSYSVGSDISGEEESDGGEGEEEEDQEGNKESNKTDKEP
jgi:hypothetical protein